MPLVRFHPIKHRGKLTTTPFITELPGPTSKVCHDDDICHGEVSGPMCPGHEVKDDPRVPVYSG